MDETERERQRAVAIVRKKLQKEKQIEITDEDIEKYLSLDINKLAIQALTTATENGFYTPDNIDENSGNGMMEKLMLVVTEVAEAAEAVRVGDFENFQEEIADTIIRLLDICGACGIDIHSMIAIKMAINEKREKLHGKKM